MSGGGIGKRFQEVVWSRRRIGAGDCDGVFASAWTRESRGDRKEDGRGGLHVGESDARRVETSDAK